jgi:hypothetical protein
MRSPIKALGIILALAMVLLAACAPKLMAATSAPDYFQALQESGDAAQPPPAPTVAQKAAPSGVSSEDSAGAELAVAAASRNDSSRLIIKNAEVRLLVADTDVAIERTTQVVTDVGGYIISSQTWYDDWDARYYKYATISIGVPVDQFEHALSRLRQIAIRVLDETASGEDVTDQFVDLQSQLKNLEATRDRIRSFLDRAQTVQEALTVNQELSEIEAEIAKIQGRMNYLNDRSAFSTITIQLEPDLPPIAPTLTPTITPTRTPTATPTLHPWELGKTFTTASRSLVDTYRVLIDILIWIVVVLLPILLPPALVILGIRWWILRRRRLAGNPPTSVNEKVKK